MKNFSDAAFSPEMIEVMTKAFEASVAALPDPVQTAHINLIAEFDPPHRRLRASAMLTCCSGSR